MAPPYRDCYYPDALSGVLTVNESQPAPADVRPRLPEVYFDGADGDLFDAGPADDDLR
jgi:hypothetical protein